MKQLLFLLSLFGLMACSEDPVETVNDTGYDFYPLELGAYRIYEVEELTYSATVEDSSHYYLKEVMADTLVSGDGTVKYLLYRYKSDDDTINWELDSVWAAQLTGNVLLVYEFDVPYCKLAFPITADKTWDGNAYNTQDEADYFYETVDSYTIGDSTYSSDDVIEVAIADIAKNLVDQDERTETYVRGVGLVEKNYITVEFCQSGCSDSYEIDEGRILRQVFLKYGKN